MINDNLLRNIQTEKARRNLLNFTTFTMPSYSVNWHHRYIANKLTQFSRGEIKKLAISIPPQHGKSELASRRFPAYVLGINPDLRIAGCSYSSSFAAKFNRQVQRIIDSEKYREIFPDVTLNGKRTVSDAKSNYLRNTSEFEIIGHDGSYLSVGVGAGITGNPVDILIIDDPVKGREEANSSRYRNKLWDWYTDEASTRLHNQSQQLVIMTRWHHDDLLGRILEKEGDEWEVINLEAIKETEKDYDEREFGEVLWEEKHSKERLLKIKKNNPRTFSSLYQGNPTIEGGNKFKSSYFEIIKRSQIPNSIKWEMFIDGAYTKLTTNDPTGIMICGKYQEKLYILKSIDRYLEMPELLSFIDNFSSANGFEKKSRIFVEPKASGITLRQLLNRKGYNAIDIKNRYVHVSKEERADAILPFCESMKIVLIEGEWIGHFIEQLEQFPNGKHDEHIDLISYAGIKNFIIHKKGKTLITNI